MDLKPSNIQALKNSLLTFFAVIIACLLIMLFSAWQTNRELKKAEAVYNTIYAFMATATGEEYGEITAELRHSLVLRTLSMDDLPYLDLIPNTAEDCPLDREWSGGLYLAALNTGELYAIAPEPAGHATLRFGYDEVSRSQIRMESELGITTVTLTRDDGEVSIQRMKRIFCEDCFSALVESQTGSTVLEFALFDPGTHELYPIAESGKYAIGNYSISMLHTGSSCELTVALTPSEAW